MGEFLRYGHKLRVASVDVSSGRLKFEAEVLVACPAIMAVTASVIYPGYANPVANIEHCGIGSVFSNYSNHLVPENDRECWRRRSAFNLIQLRMANATFQYLDQDLSFSWFGKLNIG